MNDSKKSALKPVLGFWALFIYGLGDILGAGVYALVGKVAGIAGPAAWMAFLVAFVVAALTGLIYAELSSRLPFAAGAAIFSLEAFRKKFLSTLVGFLVLFSGIISMAAASRAFAGYFQQFLPEFSENLIIILFFIVLAAINFKGMKETSSANLVCTLIELTGLLIVILAGMRFVGQVNLFEIQSTEAISPAIALLQGGSLAFYAFIGFEDMANVAEEVKDPGRTIPKALLLSLLVSTALYILVTIAAVSTISAAELGSSKAPLVLVVQKGLPFIPTWLFGLVALFAVANTALLNFVMGSRLLYGMSSQGLLPKFLSKVHPKTQTPYFSIFLIFCVVLLIAFSGTLTTLAQTTSIVLLSVFFLMNLALIVLKKRDPKGSSFSIPIVIPMLGLVCTLALAYYGIISLTK